MFGFLTEDGGFTKNGSTNIGGGVDKLLSEFIQKWNTASEVVKTTSNGTVGTALLVQEIDERLLAPATIVSGGVLIFLALSEELDGGVGRDTVLLSDGLVVSRIGIHVGDDAVLLFLEVPRDVFVDGFQRLAVSTPGSGEGDENIFSVV